MAWAPDYCTVAELGAFVRAGTPAGASSEETTYELAIAAASRAVDRHCGRQFGLIAAPEARYFTAQWHTRLARWVVPVEDVMTTTGLLIAYDEDLDETFGSSITDYVMQPRNNAAVSLPWSMIAVSTESTTQPCGYADAVRVTARWGWTAVPDPVKQATLMQASRLLSRRDSPFGIAGSPEAGSELRLQEKVDPDVKVVLRTFQRVRWAA
jgi:hypothetical protein